MVRYYVVLENVRFELIYFHDIPETDRLHVPEGYVWQLSIWNDDEGEYKCFWLTDAGASALMALSVAENVFSDKTTEELYKVAEEVMKSLPRSLRLIP